MVVQRVESGRCKDLIMNHHYAGRMVGAVDSFGLIDDGEIVGCVIYSQPASYTLCKGVCGPSLKAYVLELSRLVVKVHHRNAASMLIGRSLHAIGQRVVVSYADANEHVGHVGYVYQATNWLYTGMSTSEPSWYHPHTGELVSRTRRHIDRKAEALGLHWQDLVRVKSHGKHRYVTFAGDRRFCRRARAALRYEVLPYPKGESRRHETRGDCLLWENRSTS